MSAAPRPILVVDDDADVREVLETMLSIEGYRVVLAASGGEALHLLTSARPALVLLDLMMPGLDGFDFCARRRQMPEVADIPIVILSGGGDVRARALEVGAAAVLPKPVELRDLLDTVEHLAGPAV